MSTRSNCLITAKSDVTVWVYPPSFFLEMSIYLFIYIAMRAIVEAPQLYKLASTTTVLYSIEEVVVVVVVVVLARQQSRQGGPI
jgi:hypothetical protein